VRALMKQGIRVMAAYFEYEDGDEKGFINERLLAVCNDGMNVNQLKNDKDFKTVFKTLFRKPDAKAETKRQQQK
jgi:hypothetical protein